MLSAIGRAFFRSLSGDFHCGLRAMTREAALLVDLQSTGMEFASEMVVKATNAGLRIAEVPVVLWPDGRSRRPHLRSWRGGWRHLRFLLLYSPCFLFLYPGAALFLLGLGAGAWLLPGTRFVGGVGLDVHTLLHAAVAVAVGFQSMTFWAFAKSYGIHARIVPPDPRFARVVRMASIERGLIAGCALLLAGVALGLVALGDWGSAGFGALRPTETMRLAIPSATLILLAFQVAYAAFFLGILDIRASAEWVDAPNAQCNPARPDSLSMGVSARMRGRMFDAFMAAFGPGPQTTVMDVGVTSDRVYPASDYFGRCIPGRHASRRAGWTTPRSCAAPIRDGGSCAPMRGRCRSPMRRSTWRLRRRCWSMRDRLRTRRAWWPVPARGAGWRVCNHALPLASDRGAYAMAAATLAAEAMVPGAAAAGGAGVSGGGGASEPDDAGGVGADHGGASGLAPAVGADAALGGVAEQPDAGGGGGLR